MDIEKFYPSIDQDIMKQIVRRKIKCKDTLWLLDDIIDSSDKGLPIGNYISQYLGNLYLSKLDHTMKEDLQVKYYYRYCDDIVVLSNDKGVLHVLCKYAEDVLKELQVRLKKDYRVHPVEVGVDLLGYVISTAKVQVRSNIKRSILTRYSAKSAPSYDGVLCHCNGYGLKIRLKECVK
jgi:hypothetical protein